MIQRRHFLSTSLASGLVATLPPPTVALSGTATSYYEELEASMRAAAEGLRTRRANEPRHLWPEAPAQSPRLVDQQGQRYDLTSPDERIKLRVFVGTEYLSYSLFFKDSPVLGPSRLGLRFDNERPLNAGFLVEQIDRRHEDNIWEQPWGECRYVRDHYNELSLRLRETDAPRRLLTLKLRLYNDGLAFRYIFPQQDYVPRAITEELTEFVLAEPQTSRLWWLPGWGFARDEYLYRSGTFEEVRTNPDARTLHTPLTVKTSGVCAMFHEADLTAYAGMNLAPLSDGVLRADLVPWADGDKVKLRTGAFRSPWRVVQIAPTPSELIDSPLLLNLNEPARFAPDWVRPGKYVGIWWGYILNYWDRVPGPDYGATTARVKAYIDFASRHGFGVLIESWNKGWERWREESGISYSQPSAAFDEKEIVSYARARNVPLIGHHETSGDVSRYESAFDEAFNSLERWGARTVKTGYVAPQPGLRSRGADGQATKEWHYGQFMVEHQARLAERAAQRRVSIIAHEAVKDTGLRRTYPNLLSRECAIGQEFNGFDVIHGGNPPDHEANLVFTRLLTGPMDYTPGIFDLDFSKLNGPRAEIRRRVLGNVRVNSTLAKQLALYVVIYSPMQMAADFIENYEGHPAFRFIQDVPVDWECTRGLAGDIGEYAVIARRDRAGNDWYLGAITNETPRALPQSLTFLEKGVTYTAQIYADAPDAHYRNNPEAFVISEKTVCSCDTLLLQLAPGGGCAVRFIAPPSLTASTPRNP